METFIDRLPDRLRLFARRKLKPATATIDGITLDTASADIPRLVRKAVYAEVHEDAERKLLSRHLKANDKVLEFGGGIGFVSLVCAGVCGAEKVLTFEPNDKACDLIRRNFELNGMEPQLSQHAIATHNGELDFHLHDNIISSSVVERENTAVSKVPCRDVKEVMEEFEPTIIVMDIEGAEEDILPLVASPKVRGMVVELHPNIIGIRHIKKLIEQMAGLGYEIKDRIGGKVVWFERVSVT